MSSLILISPSQSLPLVEGFCAGHHLYCPSCVVCSPVTWDLNLVQSAFQRPSFECRDIPLLILTCKVAFLITITSVRCVSRLAALTCNDPLPVPMTSFSCYDSFFPTLTKTLSYYLYVQHLNILRMFLRSLDVGPAVQVYPLATTPLCQADSVYRSQRPL